MAGLEDAPRELIEKFWDFEKNVEPLASIQPWSKTKKVWFRCPNGHSFQDRPAALFVRPAERFCLECRSVAYLAPKLAERWDSQKNSKAANETLASGGKHGFWLLCKRGHSYLVANAKAGLSTTCPSCSSFALMYPEHTELWDWETNDVAPEDYFYSSNKPLPSFVCKEGHRFEASKERAALSSDRFCKACVSKTVAEAYPDMLRYWPEGSKVDLAVLPAKTNGRFNFKCPKGHEFTTTLNNFPKQKSEFCPTCRLAAGSFAAKSPLSASQWDSERNEQSADEIFAGAGGRYWFRCSVGHSFARELRWFKDNDGVCPHCDSQTSRLETEFGNYLQYELKLSIQRNTRKVIPPYELDVYMAKKKLAFEFNGDYWHSNEILAYKKSRFASAVEQHNFKLELAAKASVKLAFVWAHDWTTHREKLEVQLKSFVAGESLEQLSLLTKLESVIDSPCALCAA